MTTLAYKDGVVAYDSRETEGSTIVDDECVKHIVSNKLHFFFCGRSADQELLIEAVENGPREEYPDSVEVFAIVVKEGVVYTAGIDKLEEYFWQEERQGNHFACGSGQHHALTAMDCGMTAKQAVQMAAKRDANTGGKIHTYKITGKK
tara:strand:- start:992 stop:1435 length:444 start_codon:yes stop_codon:yes gene_type:complete